MAKSKLMAQFSGIVQALLREPDEEWEKLDVSQIAFIDDDELLQWSSDAWGADVGTFEDLWLQRPVGCSLHVPETTVPEGSRSLRKIRF